MLKRVAEAFFERQALRRIGITTVRRMFLTILISMLCILARVSAATDTCERKVNYTGAELKPTSTLLCTSDRSTAAGFVRTLDAPMTAVEYAAIGKEPKTSTWRITIKGDTANVIRFSGATQTLEEPELFSVEQTFGGGILLISQRRGLRGLAESPQIITIDPKNSSFIYSSQYLGPLYNRASTFYGSCQPYP